VLDLEAFERTPLETKPFPHVVVERFVRQEAFAGVSSDFPSIPWPGSFPVAEFSPRPAFQELLEALLGPEFQDALSRKFALDLAGRPTMITLRGRLRRRDGKIHADTPTKLISVLVYLNETWTEAGGRLRLLRSRDDIEDYAAEIAPVAGNMVAFRVGPDSWHGHASAFGPRRAIQLNWVTDEDVVRRELARHRFSSRWKRILPFGLGY
jgi:SM-20-related protein